MAHRAAPAIASFPTRDTVEGAARFLRARRAQNLSWMRLVEQSLRNLAELQRATPGGASLARLSTAHAGFIRDSAEVYKAATAHLSR
jgi:hypothetical protein